MNKFEFILNNNLVNDFTNRRSYNTKSLKFDVIAGNKIFLKGNLYEEIVSILSNINNSQTTFLPNRNNSSACRQFLNVSTYYNTSSVYCNFDDQAMCYSNVDFKNGHEYNIIDREHQILGIEYGHKIMMSYHNLREEGEDLFRNRLLSEIYFLEDRLFFDLLKAQSPLIYTIDDYNRLRYFLENMISQFLSSNINPECFLLHPNSQSLIYTVMNSSPGFIYGIPYHFSTLLDDNEIYLLSDNLGQMCIFNDVEFIRNDTTELMTLEINIKHCFNIIMTNNFLKVRIE